MVTFAEIAKTKKCTADEALEAFDKLEPIKPEFLIGYRWKGWEFLTGHPSNGALEAVGWYGKEFYDENNGQPLLLYLDDKKKPEEVWPVHPPTMFKVVMEGGKPEKSKHEAKGSQCRLKSILYRGDVTVSMFYDEVPINDTFKKVDENTVMGIMDNKLIPGPPFCFVLERQNRLA